MLTVRARGLSGGRRLKRVLQAREYSRWERSPPGEMSVLYAGGQHLFIKDSTSSPLTVSEKAPFD